MDTKLFIVFTANSADLYTDREEARKAFEAFKTAGKRCTLSVVTQTLIVDNA